MLIVGGHHLTGVLTDKPISQELFVVTLKAFLRCLRFGKQSGVCFKSELVSVRSSISQSGSETGALSADVSVRLWQR